MATDCLWLPFAWGKDGNSIGKNSQHVGTVPGAKEKTAKHSPVDATAVTSERLLSKYCDKMVTVGRKERQYPRPVNKCQKLP